MTEQERINTELQRQIDIQGTQFRDFLRSMDDFKQEMRDFKTEMRDFKTEMRDFKTEMRDRDNQRAAETAALRAEMINRDDKLAAMIDGMGKHVRNITIAAIVGVGAAVIGIGVMVVSLLMK